MEASKAEGGRNDTQLQADVISKAIGDFGNIMNGMAKQISDKDATISEQSKKIADLEALVKAQKAEIERYKKIVRDMQTTETKSTGVEEIKDEVVESIE